MGGATRLPELPVVTGLTGVLKGTGAKEELPGKDGEGERSMLEDPVIGIGIGLEERLSLSVVTALIKVLDALGVGDKAPASDSVEEWTTLENSVTGIGIGLRKTLSLSVVIGLTGVLDVLCIGDRVPGNDSEEKYSTLEDPVTDIDIVLTVVGIGPDKLVKISVVTGLARVFETPGTESEEETMVENIY